MAGKKGNKKKWTHIAVPLVLKKLIKRISTSQGIPMCKVVENAIAVTLVKKRALVRGKKRVVGYTVDRDFWYAFKLANTISYVKAAIDFELNNAEVDKWFNKAIETIEQIEDRLNLDFSDLKKKLKKYVENKSWNYKKDVNDETKLAMTKIMVEGVLSD